MTSAVDELLMLSDKDIDYHNLDEKTLQELSLESDPYIANSALTELLIRKSKKAPIAAWEILKRATGDYHLESVALSIVFAIDREKALDYIAEVSQDAHPYLLNKILDLLLYESDFRYEMRIARAIQQQIKGKEEELGDYLEPDVIADFAQVMNPN